MIDKSLINPEKPYAFFAAYIEELHTLTSFPRLIGFLRDELDRPLVLDNVTDPGDLTFY